MKKTIFSIILSATAMFSASTAVAQKSKPFEGVIKYSITLDESTPDQVKSMFEGAEMTVYTKENKSRTDMNMAMMSSTTLYDTKAKTAISYTDVMGQKMKMITKAEKEGSKEEVTVKDLPETKVIAGYKCKKAEITSKDSPEPLTVFYTDEIPNPNSKMKGIKGCPLEFEVAQQGIKMKMTATSVSKEKVADEKFNPPAGDYKEMTQEQLKQMSGGK